MDADLDTEHHARLTTARSRELGQELHLARKRAKLTATTVAEELGWSPGKLSKMEHGWRATSSWDYGTLLGKLGADRQTRERIQRIASEQDIGHFIRAHEGRLSDNLLCLMIHEQAALTVYQYEPMLTARMRRQSVLSGPRSPDAVFYIHEIALRTVIGDRQVMHDQMMRLAFMCEWKRLELRLIPMSRVGHPALVHAFSLMTFAKSIRPVAYSETDVATVFAEDERSIQAYQRKQQVLAGLALDAEQSRSVFARWADTHDRREDRDDQGPELAQEQLQR